MEHRVVEWLWAVPTTCGSEHPAADADSYSHSRRARVAKLTSARISSRCECVVRMKFWNLHGLSERLLPSWGCFMSIEGGFMRIVTFATILGMVSKSSGLFRAPIDTRCSVQFRLAYSRSCGAQYLGTFELYPLYDTWNLKVTMTTQRVLKTLVFSGTLFLEC